MRLTAFFRKHDVNCAKTRYFAVKTGFMHISFKALKALGNVPTY